MADGKVVIDVILEDGTVAKGIANIKKGFDGVADTSKKADKGIKDIAISLGLVKVASKAFEIMGKSMDAAISRFDTFQKFPKVMKSLGFSTEESEKAIKKLADGIDGLPTKLDDVVGTAQRMTSVTGNLNKSTDATIALNNAMLASGASTADANRGMEQYIQMLTTGQVDLQSWKTLQETMPIGLQKTAEAMGYVGETAQRDLYGALKSGEVTFRDFQDALIEIGTGTGELAELARVNSEGIATSFSNLANAASKGMANMIEALNDVSIAVTGQSIAKHIDNMKVAVNKSFDAMSNGIRKAEPLFRLLIGTIKVLTSVVKFLSPAIMGLVASFVALKIVLTINKAIQRTDEALQAAAMSGKALTIVTKSQTAALVAQNTQEGLSTAAIIASNGAITIKTALIGVLTGGIKLQTVATTIATAATGAFSKALMFLTGPIGLVVAGVGVLVAAGAGLIKWFRKGTEEGDKLNKQNEKLAQSTEDLASSVESENASRKDNISHMESSAKANADLVDRVVELSNIERKSTKDKKELKDSVELLNQSVDGLNVVYNEETEQLSMNSEAMKARIEIQKEQEKANVSQQELLEILTKQHEVEAKLKETNDLREEWNKKLEDGSVKGREHRKALEELDEQEQTLKETQTELQTAYEETDFTLQTALANVARATDESVQSQVVSFESLTEAQQSAVEGMRSKWEEYQEAATNMFDTLSDKQEISVAQMTANMAENQRVIGEWADNIVILAERGVDQGLLETLREAGPSSAGHVAAMVQASDEELSTMSDTFRNGGETATQALSTAFDTGKAGVDESVMGMVTGAKSTLTSEIQSADFGSIGKEVPNGVAKGIESGKGDVETASKDMGTATANAFKSEMGIHSPSRVFNDFGVNIAEGAEQGITKTTPKVKSAVERMGQAITQGFQKVVQAARRASNDIPTAFNSLPSQLRNVGVQAMNGLTNGIYAGSGGPLAAAANIASRIKATIKSAMDIHSPSRWMRDMIGKNMMIGWEQGIEDYSNLPETAMLGAIQGVKLPAMKAERTIGRMPTGGSVKNVNNSTSNVANNSYSYGGLFDGATIIWQGKDDIRRTMQEMMWVTETERGGMNA